MNYNNGQQQQGNGYGQRVKIGGVYRCQTRAGVEMFSGSFGYGAKIILLPNRDKQEGDNLPDFDIFVCEKPPKPDAQQQQRQAYQQGMQSGNRDASGYRGKHAWPVATGEPDMTAPMPSYPHDLEQE